MIILDTNVVSEFSGPNPDMGVVGWITAAAPSDLHITAIAEAELRYGILVLPPSRRRETVLGRIERTLRRHFAGRILPFDSHADCQIAAIAYSVGATIATRDTGGFDGCGVEVISPWSDA
ncbi:MAG: type II toxin-antitoxin system VapC family toxin [bacterium]|nr:type II toxin-antitoxin system VapC family toxin [Acidimicrobiia bacterium]MCY4649328.1 type II toxin-antitoxin system VapC family toxin [bacterium]